MNGTNWTTFGSQGTGVNQFTYPSDISIGPDGKIYIEDTYNERLVRIDDITGAGWVTYGTEGTGVGEWATMCPNGVSFY